MIRQAALWVLLGLAIASEGWGQSRLHLYPDDNLRWHEMIAHAEGGVVRMGNSFRGDVVYTLSVDNMWNETRVFHGFSTSTFDLAFSIREGGKVYLGDSSFSDAILYTYQNNQLFLGDSTFPLDVAYTIREESRRFAGSSDAPIWGVYKEDSQSWSDRVGVLEGAIEPGLVVALLSAAGLL